MVICGACDTEGKMEMWEVKNEGAKRGANNDRRNKGKGGIREKGEGSGGENDQKGKKGCDGDGGENKWIFLRDCEQQKKKRRETKKEEEERSCEMQESGGGNLDLHKTRV